MSKEDEIELIKNFIKGGYSIEHWGMGGRNILLTQIPLKIYTKY